MTIILKIFGGLILVFHLLIGKSANATRRRKGKPLTEKGSLRTCERAIREILQHLVDYPDAKDTMEGILKWWLPGGHTRGRGEIQEALDFMTLKGWLTKRNTSPPQKIYGFNKEFIEEIRKFLIGFEKDKRD